MIGGFSDNDSIVIVKIKHVVSPYVDMTVFLCWIPTMLIWHCLVLDANFVDVTLLQYRTPTLLI